MHPEIDSEVPCVVLIDNRLYGYGETAAKAVGHFYNQIAGGPPSLRRSMMDRSQLLEVTPDEASDVAEMLDAPALSWA